MKQAAIFLNGAYSESERSFYRRVIDQASGTSFVIAVDGALSLFHQLERKPDVVLGDFDSVAPEILAQFPDLPQISYPTNKDATDGELAMRYVLKQGFDFIEVFGAIDTRFETDQMLANIFCLEIAIALARKVKREIRARLTDHRQHIYLLDNSDLTLTGKQGDLLSVVPLSQITNISLVGTKWELRDEVVGFGSSRTLRNEFAIDQVKLAIKGKAIVVHRYSEVAE